MTVIALVDHSSHAASVLDHAAWAATRLDAPVEVLHAIEDLPHPLTVDRSGLLAADAPESLLEDLVELDEDRNRLMRQGGQALLEAATGRLHDAGIPTVRQRLIHGDLVAHLRDHERPGDLVVMGRHGESGGTHPGRMLERVVRGTHLPVLVTVGVWRPIDRFVFAYDGGRSAGEAINWLIETGLLQNASGHVVQVGDGTPHERDRLASATWHLRSSGMSITDETRPGDPAPTITTAIAERGAHLLVMGAFGHSRIRRLMVGSTTTELLNETQVAMLVFH